MPGVIAVQLDPERSFKTHKIALFRTEADFTPLRKAVQCSIAYTSRMFWITYHGTNRSETSGQPSVHGLQQHNETGNVTPLKCVCDPAPSFLVSLLPSSD